jgi:hypothetical protein
MVSNQGFGDHDRLEHSGPLASAGLISNGSGMDLGGWGGLQSEVKKLPLVLLISFDIFISLCMLLTILLHDVTYDAFFKKNCKNK